MSSRGTPRTRAKSLPRPPGRDAEQRPVDARERARHRPDESVARQGHRGLAGRRGLARERAGVVEVAGPVRREREVEPGQGALHLGQGAGRPASARRGVDDEADGAAHPAAPGVRKRCSWWWRRRMR